jgi:hypothetical protein
MSGSLIAFATLAGSFDYQLTRLGYCFPCEKCNTYDV